MIDLTHLPADGQIMEFPRYAEDLLKNSLEQFQHTQNLNTTPKLHLLLRELLDTIFERKSIDNSFVTNDQAIQQAVPYIKQHFAAPLTRSFMADMTGFNESYFSSLFKKETGWSFAEYVNQIRVDQAKLLLLGANDKLQDIALKTGFADGSYLGKTFTKYVHLSPSSFRKRRHSHRIVSIQFLGALVALGIQPLATTRKLLQSSKLLHKRLPTIVEIESFDLLEEIRQLEPELIVAPTYFYNYPDIMKTLEQIAPVLTIPWGQLDKLEEVRLLGTLQGRTQQAEEWINNIFFLFQHAEETGDGAVECAVLIEEKKIDEIFGWHNMSGIKENTVYVINGTAQYASKGMSIYMEGVPSHANEPENGINPAFAIAKIIDSIPSFIDSTANKGNVLCTVVQVDIGEKAFGVNASKGTLRLTIRALYEEEMGKLQHKLENVAQAEAEKYGLKIRFEYQDEFPETANHEESSDKIRQVCAEKNIPMLELKEAFRASEDFGHYTKLTKGSYCYIGNGEDYPNIHTFEYDFKDDLIVTGVELFKGLAEL